MFGSKRSMAMIRLYKIAAELDLYITDFMDCLEDLEKMIALMPMQ